MMRFLTLSAFTVQLVLGNVCLMQMASAADMPHNLHGEEMDMSHKPISSSDCEHCSKKDVTAEQPSKTMDCGSGHCFMHASKADSSSLQIPHEPITVATGIAADPVSFIVFDLFNKQYSTAPPGLLTNTDTIVLRY